MRLHPIDLLLYLGLRLAKALDPRDTSLAAFDPARVRTLLVVSSTAIGDTLLSTPAIAALRKRYPEARIVALLNRQNQALFHSNPDIDAVVPLHKGYRRFFRTAWALRKERIDTAAILHGNEPQATPLAYLSGARFIVKLPNANQFRFLLSNPTPVKSWRDFRHAIEQRLEVAALLKASSSSGRMVLPLTPEGKAAASRFLDACGIADTAPLIGFQVAASTASRMWPAERFIQLGRKLVEDFPDSRIIITGSPQEQAYCQTIADAVGRNTIVSAGRIPLPHLPALVAKFRTLVTGDTGIMHLAVAAGTPVVALFAMADSTASGPAYDLDKHTVIQKWRTCSPCIGKKCGYAVCMENISVEEVYSAVARQLANVQPTEGRHETD